MKQVFAILIITFTFLSCNQNNNKQDENIRTWSAIDSNIAGEYKGDFPCSDCEKLQVTLKLDMDKSAFKTEAEVGKDGEATSQFGTWSVNKDNEVVSVDFGDNEMMFYKSSPDTLILMDSETELKKDGKKYTLVKE